MVIVILGMIEHDRGNINEASFEMLTMARHLASQTGVAVEAVLIGQEAQDSAEALSSYGVSTVHSVQHDQLDDYAPEAWAQSIVHLIDSLGPDAVLSAGTERGNEVMAHVAALSNLPLAVGCVEVQTGEDYRVTRMRWGGSLMEEASLSGKPKLLTVEPHAVPAEENPGEVEIEVKAVNPPLTEKAFRVRINERIPSTTEGVSLADADVVIGGGRGVGSTEGFEILDQLAELLDGAVGSSRAATNQGWRAHADQIGQTGTRIAPDLYIACGISGAIQHMVGCKGAKRILAINTDPEAPIMAKSDYAVIGDLHEIIPALIAELKK